jgi:hypothetical protein
MMKNAVNQALEGLHSVLETGNYEKVFEKAKKRHKGRFHNILSRRVHLMVTFDKRRGGAMQLSRLRIRHLPSPPQLNQSMMGCHLRRRGLEGAAKE